MAWFGGQWSDGEFYELDWFQPTGEAPPSPEEKFYGIGSLIRIPEAIRKIFQTTALWLSRKKTKKIQPAKQATDQLPAAGSEIALAVSPVSGAEAEADRKVIISFGQQEYLRSLNLRLLRRVNRLRALLGLAPFKRPVIPSGLRYYYLSYEALLMRMLEDELESLRTRIRLQKRYQNTLTK